jgi:hypothetical protein
MLGLALAVLALTPAPASANLGDFFCGIGGDTLFSKGGTFLCKTVVHPGRLLGIGKKLATGHLGSVLHTITGGGGSGGTSALALAALGAWVLGGARFALHETATLIGKTTSPDLASAWFSSTYVHMAAIATLLTLPFLFAAAVQALMRSDLAMLARVALGYLPLAMLAIAIAAPVTTLLLAASDNASAIIERAAGNDGTHLLINAGAMLTGLALLDHSPFIAFLIGFFVAAGALMLWLELLVREVAVYVIVLMLPLVFAAFVWPARRIWAIRAVEVLVALILAKLAIVSVLALGAGALNHASASLSLVSLLAGVALVTLGAFAPWALVKLVPLGELAAAAAQPLRGHLTPGWPSGEKIATAWAGAGSEWAERVVGDMRRQAMEGEADRPIDGLEGVTVAEATDPHSGTAGPRGGQGGGGSGEPGPAGPGGARPPGDPGPAGPGGATPPGDPGPAGPGGAPPPGGPAPSGGATPPLSESVPEPPDTAPPEPPPAHGGLPGADAYYARERDWPDWIKGTERMRPPPADDSEPLPPAQDPEDGRL